MANHKSAAKRARQNEKRRLRNNSVTSGMRHQIREVLTAINAGTAEEAQKVLAQAVRVIDKARTSGILHRNTASRYIGHLTKRVQALSKKA